MQNYIVKPARLMGKIGLKLKNCQWHIIKKKEESVKNSSNFTHVKWLKIHKYYNKYDTLPGKTLDACGSGHQKDYSLWVIYYKGMETESTKIGQKVQTPDVDR